MSKDASQVWSKEQQYHGGQEWSMDNYVSDFSVTTNPFGTPQGAIIDACETMRRDCLHYPAADFEPALSKLSAWLQDNAPTAAFKARLQLGNGLSELIDIITRMAPPGHWRSGPYYPVGDDQSVQYKEYERAARANGRRILSNVAEDREESAAVMAIINPSNPTGDFKPVVELMAWIEATAADGSWVFVDESMLPWHSADWKSESLLSQTAWVDKILADRKIAVFVLHSWTKIWSCPGLRLGSVVAPSVALMQQLKSLQVPWSLNTAALRFLELVVDDVAYMERTWALTTPWRQRELDIIAKHFPHWSCHGESWLSWIWIKTGSVEEAERLVKQAKAGGTPIRHGKFGYNAPAFIRIAVREPAHQDALFKSWGIDTTTFPK